MQPNEIPRHWGHHFIFPSLQFTITSEFQDCCLQSLIVLMEDFLLQRSTKVTKQTSMKSSCPSEQLASEHRWGPGLCMKLQDNRHATKITCRNVDVVSATELPPAPGLSICVPPIRPSMFMLHRVQQRFSVIQILKTRNIRAKTNCRKNKTKNTTNTQTDSEINPTRCNNCVYSSQWLYSTCFGWKFHPSSGVQCCIWPLK